MCPAGVNLNGVAGFPSHACDLRQDDRLRRQVLKAQDSQALVQRSASWQDVIQHRTEDVWIGDVGRQAGDRFKVIGKGAWLGRPIYGKIRISLEDGGTRRGLCVLLQPYGPQHRREEEQEDNHVGRIKLVDA